MNNILELRKFVAPEFIYGENSRKLVGQYAKNYRIGKALIATDKGIIENNWHNDVIEILEKEQIKYEIFSNISPNPRDFEVMEGAEFFGEKKCDCIIAIGGGSVMDCAKGIGIVYSNNKNIIDFEGVDNVQNPMPPLICIPTTSGTSADVSQFAIINYTKERKKIAIISKTVVPDISLIDPVVLTTMSPFLTACTGMDALVHAVEAVLSNAGSHVTNLFALDAIKLINNNLENFVNDNNDLNSISKVMLGSLQAGLAFSNASLGCVHSLAHSLGGFLDLPHGECNAMLLPFVMEYNFSASEDKFILIGEALNLDIKNLSGKLLKNKVIDRIKELKSSVKIHNTLKDKGVSVSDIPLLAKNAIADPCNATNPRKPTKQDLEIIYKEAL